MAAIPLNTAGGATLRLYKGNAASGEELCALITTAEVPTLIHMLPGDYVEKCPDGIFYSLVDSTGVARAFVKHIKGS